MLHEGGGLSWAESTAGGRGIQKKDLVDAGRIIWKCLYSCAQRLMLVNWDFNWSSQLHQLHVASLCGLSFLKHEIQISYMLTQDSKSE